MALGIINIRKFMFSSTHHYFAVSILAILFPSLATFTFLHLPSRKNRISVAVVRAKNITPLVYTKSDKTNNQLLN